MRIAPAESSVDRTRPFAPAAETHAALAPRQRGSDPAAVVRDKWLAVVARRAGIDFARWDTSLGTAHNRDTIRASYRYYAQLFLDQPYFEWAGMANAIAPSFAAAFDDLAVINRTLQRWDGNVDRIPAPIRDALDGVLDFTRLPLQQFRQLETALLSMQKEIFVDQAVMHEAYLAGGLDAINELRQVGIIDDRAAAAWRQIDTGRRTGRAELITSGNTQLLWREQMQIVADDYDAIREQSASSPLLTYILTCVGRPAIPGSKPARDVVPIRVGKFRLPVPAIDVSRREDRWRMIELDTMPAYTRLLRNAPDELRRLVDSDLDIRIRDGRLRRLADDASTLDVIRLFGGMRFLSEIRGHISGDVELS